MKQSFILNQRTVVVNNHNLSSQNNSFINDKVKLLIKRCYTVTMYQNTSPIPHIIVFHVTDNVTQFIIIHLNSHGCQNVLLMIKFNI